MKIRSMIQLGADVTFRDMWLQMVPQAGNARGTTIYAAGHTLVLDAVDTRVGTSTLQDDVRPGSDQRWRVPGRGRKDGKQHND